MKVNEKNLTNVLIDIATPLDPMFNSTDNLRAWQQQIQFEQQQHEEEEVDETS